MRGEIRTHRRCTYEGPIFVLRYAIILVHAAMMKLHFQGVRRCVVTDTSDIR